MPGVPLGLSALHRLLTVACLPALGSRFVRMDRKPDTPNQITKLFLNQPIHGKGGGKMKVGGHGAVLLLPLQRVHSGISALRFLFL